MQSLGIEYMHIHWYGYDTDSHTKEYAEFVAKLCQAREEAGLRQIDVAKKIKRTQSYVAKVDRVVDVIELAVLEKVYNRSIDYFIK